MTIEEFLLFVALAIFNFINYYYNSKTVQKKYLYPTIFIWTITNAFIFIMLLVLLVEFYKGL